MRKQTDFYLHLNFKRNSAAFTLHCATVHTMAYIVHVALYKV